RADPERRADRAGKALPSAARQMLEMMVEERPVADRALDERGHERGVERTQRGFAELRLENAIRVCASGLDREQDLKRDLARACLPARARRRPSPRGHEGAAASSDEPC